MNLRIGVMGLGEAGAALARRLVSAWPDVLLTVYDRAAGRCEPFRGCATLAADPAEALRESDVVVLALPDEHEVDRVLERYSDGAVTADLAGKLVLDASPLDATQAGRLRAAVALAGGTYLHAAHDAAHADATAELMRLIRP
ncbi:NAD(P)-binding domain-containing protein [Bordetella sp. 2513F-2]